MAEKGEEVIDRGKTIVTSGDAMDTGSMLVSTDEVMEQEKVMVGDETLVNSDNAMDKGNMLVTSDDAMDRGGNTNSCENETDKGKTFDTSENANDTSADVIDEEKTVDTSEEESWYVPDDGSSILEDIHAITESLVKLNCDQGNGSVDSLEEIDLLIGEGGNGDVKYDPDDGNTGDTTGNCFTEISIVFDASEFNLGCYSMKISPNTTLTQVKDWISKDLDIPEEKFMLTLNDNEVTNENPFELFSNVDMDTNAIEIVRSVQIKFIGEAIMKPLHADARPLEKFSRIRKFVADSMKEPATLVGLKYKNREVLNDQSPESLGIKHGEFVQVVKKEEMKIRLIGPIFKETDQRNYIDVNPDIKIGEIKSVIEKYTEKEKSRIVLFFEDKKLNNTDTPKALLMQDTDVLWARLLNVKVDLKGLIGSKKINHDTKVIVDKTFEELKGKAERFFGVESLVFKFNGRVISTEDTPKSLNMVDEDLIVVSASVTQTLVGTIFRSGFHQVRDVDADMELKDLKIQCSNRLGIDLQDLVFKIDNTRIKDDDTLQSLKNSNGGKVITVSLEDNIEVTFVCHTVGKEPRTIMSKQRPTTFMKDWKSEISMELGEPIKYLTFVFDKTTVEDYDTPEMLAIQNGDIIMVFCEREVTIEIEGDGEVLQSHIVNVDQKLILLMLSFSSTFKIGINSFILKFGDHVLKPDDTPNLIGLLQFGTIQVVHLTLKNNEAMIEVDLQDEEECLSPIQLEFSLFPLLLNLSKTDQTFMLKEYLVELLGIPDWYSKNMVFFLNNTKEIHDDETLVEIGLKEADKIYIGTRKIPFENDAMPVFVERNMGVTTTNMGKGLQFSIFYKDSETVHENCSFRLDISKPLGEFIKKIKSRITCKSKKEKLFLSFNDELVNKDELGKTLGLTYFNRHFECHSFENLEDFKKHLEFVRNEKVEREYHRNYKYFDSQDSTVSSSSYSIDEFDLPDLPTPVPLRKYERSIDNQSQDYNPKDLQKQVKALQMRINVTKKKMKGGGISLAKDIQNHKDFENVEDILKFIGEEPSNTKMEKKKNDKKVNTKKKKKQKNKKSAGENNGENIPDVLEPLVTTDSKRDEFLEDVQISKKDNRDDKEDISDSTPFVQIENKKQKGKNKSKNIKNKTDVDSIKCHVCTLANTHSAIFCDACGSELNTDKQDWKKVSNANINKKKSPSHIQDEQKNKVLKSTPTAIAIAGHDHLCRESGLEAKAACIEKNENKSTQLFLGLDDKHRSSQQKVRNTNKQQIPTNDQYKWKESPGVQEACIENYKDKPIRKNPQISEFYEEDARRKQEVRNHDKKSPSNIQGKWKDKDFKSTPTIFASHDQLVKESGLGVKAASIEKTSSIQQFPQISAFDDGNRSRKQKAGNVNKKQSPRSVQNKIAFPNIDTISQESGTGVKEAFIEINANKSNKESESQKHKLIGKTDSKSFEDKDKNVKEKENLPLENEEDITEWCKVMVAARKNKDRERMEDYLRFREMQSRSPVIIPELKKSHRKNDVVPMFQDQVSNKTDLAVPQPRGNGNITSRENTAHSLVELGLSFQTPQKESEDLIGPNLSSPLNPYLVSPPMAAFSGLFPLPLPMPAPGFRPVDQNMTGNLANLYQPSSILSRSSASQAPINLIDHGQIYTGLHGPSLAFLGRNDPSQSLSHSNPGLAFNSQNVPSQVFPGLQTIMAFNSRNDPGQLD